MDSIIQKQQNKPLKCLIVDDEAGAVEGLSDYIAKLNFLEVAGICYSAPEAAEILKDREVDLMFLDINMPELSGIGFLESMEQVPLTIITTAYSEHALDGFRLNVVDYLLKPINFQRFFQAVQKASDLFRSKIILHNSNTELEPDVYIRQGDSFLRILWKDILYVESMQNYSKIHLNTRMYIVHQTISSLEKILPRESFYRIHKSFLINIAQIDSINGGRIFIKGRELPLSKHRRYDLLNSIVYKRLINK